MKRRILGIFAILVLSLMLIAQTPTRETWEDFGRIIGGINRAISEINELDRIITALEESKAEILNDPDRKARLIKILDVHPDFSLNWVQTRLTKLSTLKQYLEDNGHIQ